MKLLCFFLIFLSPSVNTEDSLQLFLAGIDSSSNYTDNPSVLPNYAPSINLCTTGWTFYNNNCYHFNVASYLSWSACESECSDLGASMLCIPDSITNTWISDQLSQSNSNDDNRYGGDDDSNYGGDDNYYSYSNGSYYGGDDYLYRYRNTWIGYSDLPNKDGAYHWSSGCSSAFTNIGSSDNYDCFYLDSYDGAWYSQEDEADYYITCSCQYALGPSSAPSYAPFDGESQQDSSIAYAIIIGVVVGAVVFCIVFGLTLYYCFSKEHNNKNKLVQVELSDIHNPVTDNVGDQRNEENESSNPMIHDGGPMKNAPDSIDVSTTRVQGDNRDQYMDLESLD